MKGHKGTRREPLCPKLSLGKGKRNKRRKREGRGGRKGKEKKTKGVGRFLNTTRARGYAVVACDTTLILHMALA